MGCQTLFVTDRAANVVAALRGFKQLQSTHFKCDFDQRILS
uniref:Uncharacterized protein n=1 Tax=Anguilla anguilla TaxID=7936 RepID=A0A0E9UXE4_ANGAN